VSDTPAPPTIEDRVERLEWTIVELDALIAATNGEEGRRRCPHMTDLLVDLTGTAFPSQTDRIAAVLAHAEAGS